MEQLQYVIIQLEEAKRYIETKSIPYLRLSLLLLDNAAEIQMQRTIEHELTYNDMYQRMQDTIKQTLKERPASRDDLPQSLQDIIHMKLLKRKDKKTLDKYFDEKLKYLAHELPHRNISHEYEGAPKIDTPYLDESVADVLSHLHNYRNEAYHKAKVRPETLLTAALILFEINCDLFLSLSKHVGLVYSSADHYTCLEEKYGISQPFLTENFQEKIINTLKANLPIDYRTISQTLAGHLQSRLIDLDASLKFIKDNLGPDTSPDIETALTYSQFYVVSKANQRSADIEEFKNFEAEYTYGDVETLRSDIPLIHNAATRIESFRVFGALEKKLEKIEPAVFELESDIDRYIQLQIDIARGK